MYKKRTKIRTKSLESFQINHLHFCIYYKTTNKLMILLTDKDTQHLQVPEKLMTRCCPWIAKSINLPANRNRTVRSTVTIAVGLKRWCY